MHYVRFRAKSWLKIMAAAEAKEAVRAATEAAAGDLARLPQDLRHSVLKEIAIRTPLHFIIINISIIAVLIAIIAIITTTHHHYHRHHHHHSRSLLAFYALFIN